MLFLDTFHNSLEIARVHLAQKFLHHTVAALSLLLLFVCTVSQVPWVITLTSLTLKHFNRRLLIIHKQNGEKRVRQEGEKDKRRQQRSYH